MNTAMNTTIFTIESVHGVKQTFTLGPPAKSVQSDSPKQQSSGLEREIEAKGTPTGSRSPR